jgi:ABC-type branched-subunit amino acid transport system substrate-binding protein
VKKRILFISLAVVLALSLGLIGCGGGEQEEEEEEEPQVPDYIYIFASRSVTGALSVFEDTAMGPIYKYWNHVVNDVNGGIYVEEYGQTIPVYIDVKDDGSDMDTMTNYLHTNLVTEKYVAAIGPCCTPFLEAAGPIASQYEIPLVGAEGGCTTVAEEMDQYPYMFSNLAFSNWNQVPTLCEIMDEWAAEEDDGVVDVYILSIDDLFGVEYTGQFYQFSEPYDTINILGEQKHPPFSTAEVVGPHVELAKAAGADVIILNTYPPTPFDAVGYAIESGINFKGIVTGPAACYEGWYLTFGPNSVGVCGYGAWNEYSSTALADFAAGMIDYYEGRAIMDWWGGHYYYAGLQMLEEAIKEAGSLDPTEVRDILASEKLDTIMGETWYTTYDGTFPIGASGGLLAIGCHVGEVGQWQHVTEANSWLPDGATGSAREKPYGIGDVTEYYIFEVIGPEGDTTADWIYPKPDWVS